MYNCTLHNTHKGSSAVTMSQADIDAVSESVAASKKKDYCVAEGGVFIGRVLKFSSEETDLFSHYRKSFCMAASGVNDCSLNYWLRLPI